MLVCEHLTREVKDRTDGKPLVLLDDISLVIKPTDFVCVLGLSGCGKSTLLKAMSARVPAEGTVQINGADFCDRENFNALKHLVSVVPQKEALHDLLSLETALRFTARLRLPELSEQERRSKVSDLIAQLGLEDRRTTKIRDLSGGQQKRASLANEILSDPRLLFLDEVTSGLDERTDREMMALFRAIADSGRTVICITHSLANVEDYCTHVVVLARGGRLAFVGSPKEAPEYKHFEGIKRLGDVYERLEPPKTSRDRDESTGNASKVLARLTSLGESLLRRLRLTTAKGTDQGLSEQEKREETFAKSKQREFREDDLYTKHVERRLASVQGTRHPDLRRPPSAAGKRLDETRRQLLVLMDRYWRILAADVRSMLMMSGQCLLIAILLVVVFGNLDDPNLLFGKKARYTGNLLFLMAISCLWFGCNNAAKEIVKERTIYSRERDVNLLIPSYYGSKVLLLGALSIVQALVLFAVVKWWTNLAGNTWGQGLFLSVLALVGVTMGLLISAASRSTDMAVTIVPIALIPQIALAGVIAQVEGVSRFVACTMVTAYWGYGGSATTLPRDIREFLEVDDWSGPGALFVLLVHLVIFAGMAILVLICDAPRARAGGRKPPNRK